SVPVARVWPTRGSPRAWRAYGSARGIGGVARVARGRDRRRRRVHFCCFVGTWRILLQRVRWASRAIRACRHGEGQSVFTALEKRPVSARENESIMLTVTAES